MSVKVIIIAQTMLYASQVLMEYKSVLMYASLHLWFVEGMLFAKDIITRQCVNVHQAWLEILMT